MSSQGAAATNEPRGVRCALFGAPTGATFTMRLVAQPARGVRS